MGSDQIEVLKIITWDIPNAAKVLVEAFDADKATFSNEVGIQIDKKNTQWYFEIYGIRNEETSKTAVNLFLHTHHMDCVPIVDCFFVKIDHSSSSNSRIQSPMHHDKNGWEVKDLFFLEDLLDPSNKLMVDGTLKLRCEVFIQTESDLSESWGAFNPFASDVGRMLNDNRLADFELRTNDGKILMAHKFILAARSPVFFAMLTSNMKEANEGSTAVPDFNSSIMEELLRFIYSGKVKNLDDIARELIYAADMYQLEELKSKCITRIVKNVSEENVVESLIISDQIEKTEIIFNKCIDIMLRNFHATSALNGIKDLPSCIWSKVFKVVVEKLSTIKLEGEEFGGEVEEEVEEEESSYYY